MQSLGPAETAGKICEDGYWGEKLLIVEASAKIFAKLIEAGANTSRFHHMVTKNKVNVWQSLNFKQLAGKKVGFSDTKRPEIRTELPEGEARVFIQNW